MLGIHLGTGRVITSDCAGGITTTGGSLREPARSKQKLIMGLIHLIFTTSRTVFVGCWQSERTERMK